MSNSNQFTYRINSEDQIIYVNRDWLRFAQENEAPELTETAVLGKPIWSYIKGDATRRLYQELFTSLRRNKTERSFPFNCDSPNLIRNMKLTLRTIGGNGIEFECSLYSIEPRDYVGLFDRRKERQSDSVLICSICRNICINGNWVSVESAIGRKRWLTSVPLPRLEESVCSHCERVSST
jgi:hypothetical protein